MHIIIVVKSCSVSMNSVKVELWQAQPGGWEGEGWGWREGGVGYVLQFFPAVAGLGHLSIQEGPTGALITQAPVARRGVRRRGEVRLLSAERLPLPPGLCLPVTAPIGRKPDMNYNKDNNSHAEAGTLERRQ